MRRAILPLSIASVCALSLLLMGQAPSPHTAMDLYSKGGGGTFNGGTVTGCITIDNAGNPNSTYCEAGIDRASASAQTFDIGNSLGAMSLTVDGAGVCLLPGNGLCNATGTFNYDNADGSCDIASASGDQLELCSIGAAALSLRSGSDAVYFESSGGSERMAAYVANTNSYRGGMFMIDGGSALGFSGGLGFERYQGSTIGTRDNAGWYDPDDRIAGFARTMSMDGTFNDRHAWYAAGLHSVRAVQTCDCGTTGTPNTVTCDVQSDVIHLTDGDADSCTVTWATTTIDAIIATGGVVDLPHVLIYIDGVGGGGTMNFSDSAGVFDTRGPFSGTTGDLMVATYQSGAPDGFREVVRAGSDLYLDGFLAVGSDGGGGTKLTPSVDGTQDNGSTSYNWDQTFTEAIQNGAATAGSAALSLNDDVTCPADTSGTIHTLRLPTGIATTHLTRPTCDSSHAGMLIFVDDTDDTDAGEVCVCLHNGGSPGSYSWAFIDNSKPCDT